MSSHRYCLVMAGGQGTRFWPESTSKKPKQYLNFTGNNSLLFETLKRFEGLVDVSNRFIVTVKEQEKLARDSSLNEISQGSFIFEPSGRNTAPCILLSIATLIKKGAQLDDVVAIVPSDHVILNKTGFQSVLSQAYEAARQHESIITIGIPPHFPHTGYGYIEKEIKEMDGVYSVRSFREKPDFETAKKYLESGNFLWNAGMFVASLGVLLKEFKEHSPETACFYEELLSHFSNEKKLADVYSQIPKNSIDYAIMEKSKRVQVIPARFDWNDLGSWDALETVMPLREKNILVQGKDFYLEGAEGNIVYAPEMFVSLINVNDLIVVASEKALMILPKKDAQKVKNVVEAIRGQERYKDCKDLL